MSDIFQNISEIIFLAGGKCFSPIGRGIGKPDILSCSEKSVAGFGVCRCGRGGTVVAKKEKCMKIFFGDIIDRLFVSVKFLLSLNFALKGALKTHNACIFAGKKMYFWKKNVKTGLK